MSSINLLEKNVEKILELAGFDPELRTQLEGYEIDVLLEYKTIQAIFECKQYEKSSLTVRNLIHEWTGKNEEIGADKVILVLVGISVSEEDYKLAKERNIEIWEGEKVDKLLNKVTRNKNDDLKEIILSEAGLDSSKEVEKKIEGIMDKYGVNESKAKMYLRGDMGKKDLENYSEMNQRLDDDLLQVLNEKEKLLFALKPGHNPALVEKIEFMQENQIYDKNLADDLVGYSDDELNMLNSISKRRNCNKDTANEFLKQIKNFDGREEDFNARNQLPKEKSLNLLLNVLEERNDLDLDGIKELTNIGYTFEQLKKRKDPKDCELPEKESIDEFTVLGQYHGSSGNYSHIVSCPKCGAKRGVNFSLREEGDTIQCSKCNTWNTIRNMERYIMISGQG